MDDDSKPPLPGADGWIDPYAPTEYGLEAIPDVGPAPQPPQQPKPLQPAQPTRPVQPTALAPKSSIDEGKPMALLSHASVLLGMPLFVIPMLQKDNEFALHHSKAAAVNFIFFIIAVSVTVITCGLAFPLIFLVYIPMIVGCVNAANGQRAGGWGWGGIGEKMFHGLHVNKPDLLE